MATAVQTSQPQPGSEPRASNPTTQLLLAGLIGAVYLLAAVAVAGYAVPLLWKEFVAPVVQQAGGFVNAFLRVVVQVGAIAGLVVLGTRLTGAHPPKGLRGAIFLWLAALVLAWLVVLVPVVDRRRQMVPRPAEADLSARVLPRTAGAPLIEEVPVTTAQADARTGRTVAAGGGTGKKLKW